MKHAKFIFVLDFIDGNVYRYYIGNDNHWNPDDETIYDFLTELGHNVNNCQFMVTSESEVVYNNINVTKNNKNE